MLNPTISFTKAEPQTTPANAGPGWLKIFCLFNWVTFPSSQHWLKTKSRNSQLGFETIRHFLRPIFDVEIKLDFHDG
jgi:hypothetical protein